MAEARSAIHIFEGKKRGVNLLVSNEGVEIHFLIPHPREIRANVVRTCFSMARAAIRGVYPAPPPVALLVVLLAIAMVLTADPDSWWRSGWLATLIWHLGNWLVPYSQHLNHHSLYLAYLAAVGGFCCLLLLMAIQRLLIRGLLCYKGWLYLQPKQTSALVYAWGGILKLISGKNALTFAFQDALPRLPLPSVEETCERYLQSIHPLCSTEEEYARVEEMTQDFIGKDGPKLQWYLRLKSWWSTNYVTDWWEKYVYLQGRDSIMINSNYFITGAKHIPTTNQAARTAGIIHYIMEFKQLLDREQLEPLLIRDIVPLCMNQYKRLFSSTRIPGREEDTFKTFPARKSRHIAVLSNGKWFKLYLYQAGAHGRMLTAFEIQRQLNFIQMHSALGGSTTDLGNDGFSHLAALTSDSRVSWADNREKYFSEGINKISINVIESAIFVLVLESKAPGSQDELSQALFHGNGSNIWFDKSICLITYPNGQVGLNVEHSWADAPVAAHMWEYALRMEVINDIYGNDGLVKSTPEEHTSELHPCKLLKWQFEDSDTTKEFNLVVEKAKASAVKAISEIDMKVLIHNQYGKGFMKKCGISPDAFIQLAIQLAYYENTKTFTQTYESSMTRLYRNGRTETVRPVTDASKKFVLTMVNSKIGSDERIKLFKEAAEAHQDNYKNAMSGKGIDRHLFTLYCVAVGMGIESPFLKDALGRPWKLSTSQQPQTQTKLFKKSIQKFKEKNPNRSEMDMYSPGGGFGPVAANGYGISYMITGENQICFHISSKKTDTSTDSNAMAQNILEAFESLKKIFD